MELEGCGTTRGTARRVLYHYTSTENAAAILRHGVVEPRHSYLSILVALAARGGLDLHLDELLDDEVPLAKASLARSPRVVWLTDSQDPDDTGIARAESRFDLDVQGALPWPRWVSAYWAHPDFDLNWLCDFVGDFDPYRWFVSANPIFIGESLRAVHDLTTAPATTAPAPLQPDDAREADENERIRQALDAIVVGEIETERPGNRVEDSKP